MGHYCEVQCDFYSERRVRARKQHKCCETGRVIEVGEFYWRCVGSWEGEFGSFAQSEAAYHYARYANSIDPDSSCIGFGGIYESFVADSFDDEVLEEWEKVKRGIITRPGV